MSDNKRRLVGRVVRNRMDKTATVMVERAYRHSRYKKVVRERKKYYAHDEENTCRPGDTVRIVESRPLSRLKRWVVEEVLDRAELPEVEV